jgi:Na+/H+-dicarboxylate symporter
VFWYTLTQLKIGEEFFLIVFLSLHNLRYKILKLDLFGIIRGYSQLSCATATKPSDFIIPIGATINMDGTAMSQCATTLFMAQAYGMELSIMNLLLLTFTVVASSIGTPAIPGGGIIILASVLQSVGIPIDGIIVIVGLDRILGMFKTAVNVTGDLIACLIFDKFYGTKQSLKPSPKKSETLL